MRGIDVKPRALLARDIGQRHQVIEAASRGGTRRAHQNEPPKPGFPGRSKRVTHLRHVSAELRVERDLEHRVTAEAKNCSRSRDRIVRLSSNDYGDSSFPALRGLRDQSVARCQ